MNQIKRLSDILCWVSLGWMIGRYAQYYPNADPITMQMFCLFLFFLTLNHTVFKK